jgi:hypothetical protein
LGRGIVGGLQLEEQRGAFFTGGRSVDVLSCSLLRDDLVTAGGQRFPMPGREAVG